MSLNHVVCQFLALLRWWKLVVCGIWGKGCLNLTESLMQFLISMNFLESAFYKKWCWGPCMLQVILVRLSIPTMFHYAQNLGHFLVCGHRQTIWTLFKPFQNWDIPKVQDRCSYLSQVTKMCQTGSFWLGTFEIPDEPSLDNLQMWPKWTNNRVNCHKSLTRSMTIALFICGGITIKWWGLCVNFYLLTEVRYEDCPSLTNVW